MNRAASSFGRRACASLAATAALALFSTGCVVVGNNSGTAERESRSVELNGARSVQVNVEMGAGELKIRGGAAPLMDAGMLIFGA